MSGGVLIGCVDKKCDASVIMMSWVRVSEGVLMAALTESVMCH